MTSVNQPFDDRPTDPRRHDSPTTLLPPAAQIISLVHPSALAAAWVLTAYVDASAPLWAVARPLAVAVGGALVLQIAVSHGARGRVNGSLLTAGFVALLLAVWPVAVAVIGLALWTFLVDRVRSRQNLPGVGGSAAQLVALNSGFAGVVLVGWLSIQAGAAATESAYQVQPVVIEESSVARADIYLVLLDGYPRADVLKSRFGIDNSPFLAELERRDFAVSSASRSTYSATWLTLASLFQMNYVHEMEAVDQLPTTGPSQYRVLSRLINSAPVIAKLRSAGYRIVSSPTAYSDVALANADQVFATVAMTTFEQVLMERSVLATLAHSVMPDWMAAMQRERIAVALDRLEAVALRRDRTPVFMFDHILSPHPPFVYREDGSHRPLPHCFPQACHLWAPYPVSLGISVDEYADGLAGQVEHLNRELLAKLDVLINARPGAVIILFSDHATRYDTARDPLEANLNFFAARTPGRDRIFGEAPTTVNILPTLLNWTLGESLPLRPDRVWLSGGTPLELRPVSE